MTDTNKTALEQIAELAKTLDYLELSALIAKLQHVAYYAKEAKEKEINKLFSK